MPAEMPESVRGPVGDWVDFYRDLGVHDFYRRGEPIAVAPATTAEEQTQAPPAAPSQQVPVSAADDALPPVLAESKAESDARATLSVPTPPSFNVIAPLPSSPVPAAERGAALQAIREEIGDCTRCPLAYAGRRSIVFGDGSPAARVMFVGEGPGADEDVQGVPFVGKAGQLLNNMITAMGLAREDVYIANIVKCRPPNNRVPEPAEANTCTQFLVQQIDVVRPQVIVALGATAATYLLGAKQSLSALRGRWHDVRGSKTAVTYHPAFLLRDPRMKAEAWKDLQMVMGELGLKPPKKA